ncbi:hypothetical protein ACHAWF_004471 [Thalassiosira exigua]
MQLSTFLRVTCFVSIAAATSGFSTLSCRRRCGTTPWKSPRTSSLFDSAIDVEDFLAENYPSCSALLAKNGDAMKKIIKSEEGFTIFAPNEAAFSDLGERRRSQLEDIRNDEVTEKIASYHVIAEPVTADQLFNSGGVVTVGGEVPAERSVSGGFFGVGGKEDGGVTLNGAKVVKSMEFADASTTGIVHEVDGFISPSILWRYVDQLKPPATNDEHIRWQCKSI